MMNMGSVKVMEATYTGDVEQLSSNCNTIHCPPQYLLKQTYKSRFMVDEILGAIMSATSNLNYIVSLDYVLDLS